MIDMLAAATATEMLTWSMWAAIILLATAMCGIYCGLETGIYVMNKVRLDLHSSAGRHRPKLLRRMLLVPNNLLVVLLIGTNLAAYIVTFAISALFINAGAGEHTEWYTIACATPLLFVFGESVPKSIFQRGGEQMVYKFTWALKYSSYLYNATGLAPLVRGFAWLLMLLVPAARKRDLQATHPLSAVMAEGTASGALTHFQSIMAERVMNISKVTLRDAMTPMAEVVTVRYNATRDDLTQMITDHNYSHLPVIDAGDQVIGMLNIYAALMDEDAHTLAGQISQPLRLDETTSIVDTICEMRKAGTILIIVQDASGNATGLATPKDLAEEIVGELEAW